MRLWLGSRSRPLPPRHPRPHGGQSRQSRQPRSALSLVKVPLDGTRISKMVPALDCAHGRAGRQRHGPPAVPVSGAEEPRDSQEGTSEPPRGAATTHLTRDSQKQGLSDYIPPTHLVPARLQAGKHGCKAVAPPNPPRPRVFTHDSTPPKALLLAPKPVWGWRPPTALGRWANGRAGFRLGIG